MMPVGRKQLLAQLGAARRLSRYAFAAQRPVGALKLAISKWSGRTREVNAELFFGVPMTVVLPEVVSTELFRHGMFEPALTAMVVHLLRPGDVFYDVGTHLGYYSILAAEIVGGGGQVVALEPTPRTRAVLTRNLARYPQAQVLPDAAWFEPAELSFNDYGWRMSAYNSFSAGRLDDRAETIKVRARTLDAIISETGRTPDLLKIDAEAAELYVLQGLEKTMRDASPYITVETGDFTAGAPKTREVIDFAMALGYQPYDFIGGSFHPHQPQSSYGYSNILLSKRSPLT